MKEKNGETRAKKTIKLENRGKGRARIKRERGSRAEKERRGGKRTRGKGANRQDEGRAGFMRRK